MWGSSKHDYPQPDHRHASTCTALNPHCVVAMSLKATHCLSNDHVVKFLNQVHWAGRRRRRLSKKAMATSVMGSLSLKPSLGSFGIPRTAVGGGVTPLKVVASGVKKIKTNKPYGINGDMNLENGVDASGRKARGKGVYQFVDKYGANVDGYSPIYNEDDWSPSGEVYVGGTTGLLIWAVTLAGLLAGGALLVYNTSALAS